MTESNNPPPGEPGWGGSGQPPGQQPGQQPGQPPQQGWQGNAPQPPPMGTPKIPNYLVHSIVATVLCCLPAGIVGIVYASQVNGKLASGDIAGAQKASQNARLWTIISVVAGLVFGVIYFVFVLGMQNP